MACVQGCAAGQLFVGHIALTQGADRETGGTRAARAPNPPGEGHRPDRCPL